jgi:hypothetical protein
MATAKKQATSNPLIQIDDVVREMTDQEYADYLAELASMPPFPPTSE